MVSEEQNSDVELASEVIPVPQVQPQLEASEVVDTNDNAKEKRKDGRHKPRHRKKALHAAILKLMEFYFGDSNLTKDRFLGGLVKQNPDVDLEIFLRFNKMRALTTDVARIAKALSNSTMLQVSEDGTKVRRITPIVEKKNIDECTVYVQRLPIHANHDWLTKIFSEYGPVAYVSIPKFKFNHKIKGFAFVEFENPESAQKCLKAFRAEGCELPSQTAPTDVLSITTYNEENQEQDNMEQSDEDDINEKIDKNTEEKVIELEKCKKKQKKPSKSDDAISSGTDQCLSDSKIEKEEKTEKHTKKRKNRNSLEDTVESDIEAKSQDDCKKLKKVKLDETVSESESSVKNEPVEIKDNNETVECSNGDENSGKKKKKRKKHDETVSESENPVENEPIEIKDDKETVERANDEENSENKKKRKLEAVSESESSVKSEPIEIKDNKETVKCSNGEENSEKKKKKRKLDEAVSESENSIQNEPVKVKDSKETVECSNGEENSEKKKKKKRKRKSRSTYEVVDVNTGLQVMGKKDWKKLRNKYLELQRTKMKQLKAHIRKARWNQWGDKNKMEYEQHEDTVNNKKNNLEFKPGVIVKVELSEACIDPKSFKAELKSNTNIKYIEIKEGSNVAFIRCDSSEAATTISQKTNDKRCYKVLTGDEEKSYWDKISRDREEKISKKIRPKQRGRSKLLKKAEKELGKHIRFDEV